ncbi:hypothetical protein [Fundidesulfovibrio soli]|uniref:hypothetical protein n=1 Tax=Fundidesulfovibrio soli TaxID=2922716 RepID=UPI001FAF25A5|nr:hypothetical protein [Fundidesulfovibrio soli]
MAIGRPATLAMASGLILACLLAGGCGGAPRYERHGATPAQQEQDNADCAWEAAKATGNMPGTGREERVQELMDACMRAKGYAKH